MQSKLFVFVGTAMLGALLASGCAKPSDSADSAATAAPASPAAPSATAADLTRGEAIYAANCVGCHGAKGVSNGIGPSLIGEKSRKNTAAAIAWIKNPQPPMAKLYPSPLSEKDVADVAAYVESL